MSFVVAETMKYSQPVFAGLIDGYHAIVKKQFYADYTCIKTSNGIWKRAYPSYSVPRAKSVRTAAPRLWRLPSQNS